MAKPGDIFLKCVTKRDVFEAWDNYYNLPHAGDVKMGNISRFRVTSRKIQGTGWSLGGEQSNDPVINGSSYLHVTGFYSQEKI